MPKNDETQIILDYIVDNVALTGYGEDGEEFIIPSYVRVDDIVTEFSVDEDDVVEIAKDNGYLIFDNKADVAEGLYIAHPEFDIETFKNDFQDYYDSEADIEIVFQPEVEDETNVKETEVEIEDKDESLEEDKLSGTDLLLFNTNNKEGIYLDPVTGKPSKLMSKEIEKGKYKPNPDREQVRKDIKTFVPGLSMVSEPKDTSGRDLKKYKVKEDTVKQGSHWVNKGEEGTHGKFKTKKAADAQRKAMFANGYKESYQNKIDYQENPIVKIDDVTAFWDSPSFDDGDGEYYYEIEYHADYPDEEWFVYIKAFDDRSEECSSEDIEEAGFDVDDIEAKLKAEIGDVNIDEDYNHVYWCVSDGINPRRSMMFTSEESAIKAAKANPRFKFVDKVVNGTPTTIWEKDKEEVTESVPSKRVEWCIMDKLGNNAFGCYDTEEEAMKVCKSEPEAFSVVGVEYGDDGEEISASTIYEKDWDNGLNEAKEPKIEIPEDFDGRMDFLAADEQEAIDGYDLIIAALGEDEANVKEQLEKIRTEEIAHKEFLEKVKADHNLIYTEPLEPEVEVEDEVKVEEDKKKVTSEDIDKFINDIYALRKEGIEEEGEFSLKNLVFKEARALGYLDHLKKLKHQLRSQELSLEGLEEELNTSKYNTKEKLAQLRKEIEEDGTYSADEKGNLTREELKDGFMVSFFRPEIKDSDIAVVLKTIGTKLGSPYLGIFEDAPEISYRFDDEDRAMEFAKIFNQQSIWDNENMTEIANPDFKKTGKVRYSSVLDKVRQFINPSVKPIDEDIHRDTVTLYYPNLEITTWTKTSDAILYPADDAHPAEYDDEDIKIEYEYKADKDEVINALYELIGNKDEWADKEDDEIFKHIEDNLDDLVEDNMDYLCDYFKDSARSQAEDYYIED